jgi:hypothetical protein
MARKIEVKNEDILKSLIVKDELVKEVLKIEAEAEKLTKRGQEIQVEYEALHSKLVREDEKVRPLLIEEKDKIELAEYEEVSRVYLGKDKGDEGKIFIEVADRLEEFKAGYAQAKEKQSKQDNSSDSASTDGDSNTDTTEPSELSEKSGD